MSLLSPSAWWRSFEESDFARSIPLGNRYRPAGFSLDSLPAGSLAGRVVLITGASAGIGRRMAAIVAAAGATTVLGCRSESKGQAAIEEILSATPGASVAMLKMDLGSRQSIARAAAEFAERYKALHVLVNNGGIPAGSSPLRLADGVEECFQARAHRSTTLVWFHGAPWVLPALIYGGVV